jgi:hypothetical protein
VQQPSQRAVALPLLKTAMAGLIGRIAFGQIVPRSTGAQNPKNAVQHKKRKKEPEDATLAMVGKEVAAPRMARSARMAELDLDTK